MEMEVKKEVILGSPVDHKGATTDSALIEISSGSNLLNDISYY